MSLQNVVTPCGEIIEPGSRARGLFMGNRGILHDAPGRLGPRRWTHKCWIICQLEFRNRRRPLMEPKHYTVLFFLDEAVALAAGHRPCYECRRDCYNRFAKCWRRGSRPTASDMNCTLHKERVNPANRQQIKHTRRLEKLPTGAFVELGGDPWLVLASDLARYTAAGYDRFIPRPRGEATVLTPPASIRAIAGGYSPALHPSAFER